MAVAIDFGDFPGVNMQDPKGLGAAIFSDFSTFVFNSPYLSPPTLDIPNHVDPTHITAFVRAYSNNWAFDLDGTPADGTIVYAVEVWAPGSGASTFDYRIVIDGFTTFFPAIENALISHDLSLLYAGQSLQILGTQTHDDTLVGGNLDDDIRGYGGNDVLTGNAGNDFLDGMGGKDTLNGGAGKDDYGVNSSRDVIQESDGQGLDLVLSTVSYVLPAFVEDLALLDSGGRINGTGNGLGNFMEGNLAANRLAGGAGNDSLGGLYGNDTLSGGQGQDTLDGGKGADSLAGGQGNDKLVWQAADVRLDGGDGSDTLSVGGGALDLTRVNNARIVNIETIDLRGDGANRLTLAVRDVLDISSSSNTLKVLGERGDSVNLPGSFHEAGEVGAFTRYRSEAATLLVDSVISVA